MDVNKLLSLSTTYLSEYVSTFLRTLLRPGTESTTTIRRTLAGTVGQKRRRDQLNPKLLSFAAISAFLGSILNGLVLGPAIIPFYNHTLGSVSEVDRTTIVVVVIVCWFFYSVLAHGLSLLFGGKGTVIDTLSVSIQLMAVLYVVSNLGVVIFQGISQSSYLLTYFEFIPIWLIFAFSNPLLCYVVLNCLLLAVYLPLSLKKVHGFGGISRSIMVTVLLVLLLVGLKMTLGPLFQFSPGAHP